MVENRPLGDLVRHLVLIAFCVLIGFPIWIAFVTSTLQPNEVLSATVPVVPGDNLIHSYWTVLTQGAKASGAARVDVMMLNSLVMAVGITVGKIAISLLAAFAIVFFRFPFRTVIFWMIFITLMLPVEVRIVPTFAIVARLDMLNSYWGLTIPLIASATATFLFRQFFKTIPAELVEAARIDGAGPLRFFKDILLPLSRTNIAALCVILFIYGWNQYLWPLLVTTKERWYTIVMAIQRMVNVADSDPQYNLIMAATILALIPPVIVVIVLQRLFVKGLVESEK